MANNTTDALKLTERPVRSDLYDETEAELYASMDGQSAGPESPETLVLNLPEFDESGAELDPQGLSDDEVLNIASAELDDVGYEFGGSLTEQRQEALRYYEGRMPSAPAGRSQATSTDVADVIEWCLPQIMRALVASENVALFDATGEDDEEQAQLETDACEHVLFQENDGFTYFYTLIKDALMQKNGIGKVFYDDAREVEYETWTGLTEQEAQTLLNPDDGSQVEIVEGEEGDPVPVSMPDQGAPGGMPSQGPPTPQGMSPGAGPPQPGPQGPPGAPQAAQGMAPQPMGPQPMEPSYNLVVRRTRTSGKFICCPVPPEEFAVNRDHESIILAHARFTRHRRLVTRSDLVAEGWDRELVDTLPTYSVDVSGEREQRRSLEEESDRGFEGASHATQRVVVHECYAHIDQDQDGIAELLKVDIAGDESRVLMGWERAANNPFVSVTPFMLSHKFYGWSLYDKVKEIQEQKTVTTRAIQDNLDHQNNVRTLVVAGQVNLDDLLTSRPGGVIRQKQPGMVESYTAPQIGDMGYRQLEYLDQVRTSRVGVSPDTASAVEAIAGDTAHGLERLMSAKEELVGLIIQLMANTGYKATLLLLRQLLRRHRTTPLSFKKRGKWQKVSPADWDDRAGATVPSVLSHGQRMRKANSLAMVIEQQKTAMEMGADGVLVTLDNVYHALSEFARVTDVGDPSPYWTDPQSEEAQAAQQAKQEQAEQAEQEAKEMQGAVLNSQIQIEQMKTQAGQMKAMLDAQTAATKTAEESAQKAEQLALDAKKAADELLFKYSELEINAQVDIAGQGMTQKPTSWGSDDARPDVG